MRGDDQHPAQRIYRGHGDLVGQHIRHERHERTEYGVLYSHAAQAAVTPAESWADALTAADTTCTAQPGIEYELMCRPAGTDEPWRSALTGMSAVETVRDRWDDPR